MCPWVGEGAEAVHLLANNSPWSPTCVQDIRNISMEGKLLSYAPEFIVLATLRTNGGRNNEWDQGGQNSENNFELHVYKSRRVVGVVRNE